MGSTNYTETFIAVAEDCPVDHAVEPPATADSAKATVASLTYELLAEHAYELTSDDVLFEVHAIRHGLGEGERDEARAAYFAKGQACLRASPLAKRYGWGSHHDERSRVALVALGTPEYADLAARPDLDQKRAMRSRRA